MKKIFFAVVALLCVARLTAAPELPPGVKVLFGPQANLEDEIIKVIEAAKSELLFSQAAITTPRIAAAIAKAFQVRKVYVAGIIERDPGIKNYTTPEYFRINGIPVVFSARTNDNNYLVVDQTIVLTGSASLTRTSLTKNSTNIIVIQEPSIAAAYRKGFADEFEKGELLAPPAESTKETK